MAILYNQDLLYAKSNRKILGAQKKMLVAYFSTFCHTQARFPVLPYMLCIKHWRLSHGITRKWLLKNRLQIE